MGSDHSGLVKHFQVNMYILLWAKRGVFEREKGGAHIMSEITDRGLFPKIPLIMTEVTARVMLIFSCL